MKRSVNLQLYNSVTTLVSEKELWNVPPQLGVAQHPEVEEFCARVTTQQKTWSLWSIFDKSIHFFSEAASYTQWEYQSSNVADKILLR